ncbi:bZIP transcription factor [Halobacteria archaeon HArc-gm2]|nr:bZIP transcription factor [Halobacteria archaeon HArc-gm2]
MCGNRVEELESRVKELEASVEGLTDELVECKVRLRELENAVDTDIGLSNENAGSSGDSTSNSAQTDTTPAAEQGAADTHKAEDATTEDNREESEADSGSDIIVA